MIKRVCAGLSALLVLSLSACRPKDDTPASSAAPAASGTGSAVTTASTTGTAPETTTAARQEPTASRTKTPLKPTTAATTTAADYKGHHSGGLHPGQDLFASGKQGRGFIQ